MRQTKLILSFPLSLLFLFQKYVSELSTVRDCAATCIEKGGLSEDNAVLVELSVARNRVWKLVKIQLIHLYKKHKE